MNKKLFNAKFYLIEEEISKMDPKMIKPLMNTKSSSFSQNDQSVSNIL